MGVRGKLALLALVATGGGSLVASAAPRGGTGGRSYSGHTSQRPGHYGPQRLVDNDVSFTLAHGRVENFTIAWLDPCAASYNGLSEAPLIDRSEFDPIPLTHGSFSVPNGGYQSSPGKGQRANVQLVLKGTVIGRRASGTLSVVAAIDVDGVYTSDFCSTHKPIHWQATAAR